MKIYIGSDHGGFALKEELKTMFSGTGFEFEDLGSYSEASVDYPDIAKKMAEGINKNQNSKGILLCGTGLGMSMVANKINGIRAAVCTNEYMARKAREHNDANILCLGGRVVGPELAKSIVEAFLTTDFSTLERYQKRIDMME